MKRLTYCQSVSATGASRKMANITSGMAVRDESWSCFHPRRGIPDRKKRGTSCVDAVSVRKRKRNPPVHHESCIFVWKWYPDRNEKYIHISPPLLFQTLSSFPRQLSAFLPIFPLTLPDSSICVPQRFPLLPSLLVVIDCPPPPLFYAVICWPNAGSEQLRMEGTHCKHRGKRERQGKKRPGALLRGGEGMRILLVRYEKKTRGRKHDKQGVKDRVRTNHEWKRMVSVLLWRLQLWEIITADRRSGCLLTGA